MKFFSANLKDLRELYISNLRKALDLEQQITEALPTMIEKATDPHLKDALSTHLNETRGHVSKVTSLLQQTAGDDSTETCKVIRALVTEAQDGIKDAADESVMDMTIIAAAQQVEHHEMAVYGTLRSWAEILGDTNSAATLEQILDEEKNADALLTEISDSVNTTAETPAYSTVS